MKKVGIIGNGFVGSAMAFGFGLHAEIRIYDKAKTKAMNTLEDTVNNSEFVFLCLPTPMETVLGGQIDLSIIESAFDDITKVDDGQNRIYVIKSTVIPGTTLHFKKKYPKLNIAFNPEFLTERAAKLDFINASRVVLGGSESDTARIEELYRDRFPYVKIIRTDSQSAEFIKYMCTCFFATKVSFINEMKQATDKLGLDWGSIMNGFISDGRMGNSHFDVPGHDGLHGFGGKCFPKDINAFISFYEQHGIEPKVLKSVWDKNLEVREEYDWSSIEGAVSKDKSNG